jgi:hypothetical protein
MRIKLLILILLGLNLKLSAQNLRLGFGFVNQMSSSSRIIQLDSVMVFEDDQQGSFDLMPFLSFEWPITERLYSNLGVQFYKSAVFLETRYTSDSYPKHIPFITKGWSTPVYNVELPFGLSYSIFRKKNIRINVDFMAVPVWSIQNFTPLSIDVPQGIDWTQEILDVLNAVETIPSSFYMNYQYGLSVGFNRIGVTLFRANNMNRSISNGYTLYGTTYSFERRIRSTRIGLYYSFGLKKKEKG